VTQPKLQDIVTNIEGLYQPN